MQNTSIHPAIQLENKKKGASGSLLSIKKKIRLKINKIIFLNFRFKQ